MAVMIEDTELLRRYAEEKSEDAFAELVRRHVNFVYACAVRRVGGNAQLAEDVTQQVFAVLARDAGKVARRDVVSGWLYVTARNVAVQVVRSERRRAVREQEAHTMNELTATAAQDAEWARLRPVIDEAMDDLREEDREAAVAAGDEAAQRGKVKHGAEQRQILGNRVDDFQHKGPAEERRLGDGVKVERGERARAKRRQARSLGGHGRRDALGRGAAVAEVVLDAKVLLGAARVVARRQDDSAARLPQ